MWAPGGWGGGPPALSQTHLEGRDVGAGAIAVDLVHGALQGHGLLGQALEVLGALLGLLMVLAQLQGRERPGGTGSGLPERPARLRPRPGSGSGPPGSCRWCSLPSRAAGLTGTRLCSHRRGRRGGGYGRRGAGREDMSGPGQWGLTRGVQTNLPEANRQAQASEKGQ